MENSNIELVKYGNFTLYSIPDEDLANMLNNI